MNNERSVFGSSNSSSYDLSSIVFQKMLIKNFAEAVPPELQKYRMPNLVESYVRRITLARQAERNPRLPPTRIVISDFSKKPTEAERLSNLRGNLTKEKNKKSTRTSKARKRTRQGSYDINGQLKVNAASRRTSRQSFMMKPSSGEVTSSKGSFFREVPTIDISTDRGSRMHTGRKSSQNRSYTASRMNFLSPFQYHSYNANHSILKTKVRLKDFSRSIKTEPVTSSRAKQLKEIDDLMIALNDTQISRKTVEMALLLPEDLVKRKEKLYYKDFEYIRSWVPDRSTSANQAISADEKSPQMEKERISAISDNSPPLSDNYLPIMGNDSSTSAKPVLKSKSNPVKMRMIKAKKTAKHPPRSQSKPRKAQTISDAKMLVKPLDLIHSDSDQYLNIIEKPKTSCWWNASELKMLRAKLMKKKENDKQIKIIEHPSSAKFKTANQIQRPNSQTAHRTTKYMKSPRSIDQLPIDPHLDRQYIMHTQAVAQGRNNFRNSIWLSSQRPTSRPKTASLFHMENGSMTTIRRRSFSMGYQKIDVSVQLPAEPSHGYLQIYVPREHPHHLI